MFPIVGAPSELETKYSVGVSWKNTIILKILIVLRYFDRENQTVVKFRMPSFSRFSLYRTVNKSDTMVQYSTPVKDGMSSVKILQNLITCTLNSGIDSPEPGG